MSSGRPFGWISGKLFGPRGCGYERKTPSGRRSTGDTGKNRARLSTFYFLHNLFKYLWLVLAKCSEYLAINRHIRFSKPIYKSAVRDAVPTRGGIYFYIPEPGKFSFLFAAVVESARPGMKQCLFRCAIVSLPAPFISLRVLEQVSSALRCNCSSFDSWHTYYMLTE